MILLTFVTFVSDITDIIVEMFIMVLKNINDSNGLHVRYDWYGNCIIQC